MSHKPPFDVNVSRTIINGNLGTVHIISESRVKIDGASYDKYTVSFLAPSKHAAEMKAKAIARMLSDRRLIRGDVVVLTLDNRGVPEPGSIFGKLMPDRLRRDKWVAEIAIVDRGEQ